MKKLLFVVGLCGTMHVSAANYTLSSFLRQPVVSIVISNAVGITNLDTIAQNGFGGAAPQTNSLGQVTNVVTKGWLWYTSAPPVSVGGVFLPGTLVIVTNNTPVNPGTNSSGVVTNGINVITNSTFNLFQDVSIEPPDAVKYGDPSKPGAANITNILGTLVVKSYPNLFNVTGSANAGSNIVNLVFTPIVIDTSPLNQGQKYEASDLAFAAVPSFTVTYTNSPNVLGTSSADPTVPTVFTFPVPQYLMGGANGLRLRSVYSGNTTNAVWIGTIALGHWTP